MNTQEILDRFKPSKEYLLPILHAIQDSNPQNFLPDEALKATAKFLNLPLSSVYGVVGYYTMFSRKPRGRYVIRFCTSPVCGMMGSISLLDWFKQWLKVDLGETTPNGLFTLEESECLGRCGKAPSMMINQDFHGNLTPEILEKIIHQLQKS